MRFGRVGPRRESWDAGTESRARLWSTFQSALDLDVEPGIKTGWDVAKVRQLAVVALWQLGNR